jgi:hypothetical protein
MQYAQRSLQRSVIDTRKYEIRWPKRSSIFQRNVIGIAVFNQEAAQLTNKVAAVSFFS